MPVTQFTTAGLHQRQLTLHLNSNRNPQHIPVKHKQQRSQLLQRKKLDAQLSQRDRATGCVIVFTKN